MAQIFSRTELLFGEDNMKILKNSRVAVFGVGGVGGYTVEALARSGVGSIDIIDNDVVSLTNINRQIIATHDTVGRKKVDVMKERILSINPNAKVCTYDMFFLPDIADKFAFGEYDYIVDAIDTVAGKIALAEKANEYGIKIISSMGAGNKINPEMFEVADIYETSVCPLARAMRRELNKRGIKHLKVVFSKEKALTPQKSDEITSKRQVPGSVSFVPSVAGLIIAGEVIKDLLNLKN
ncbi:MAG: tRNA threonylcarbamoyladenosine dehydratase [Clostridia bacterium]|nr:tRNA threonylcarbamoyladenosine dehydratase [Clostridia bacterium]